jgi:hypothetical protein
MIFTVEPIRVKSLRGEHEKQACVLFTPSHSLSAINLNSFQLARQDQQVAQEPGPSHITKSVSTSPYLPTSHHLTKTTTTTTATPYLSQDVFKTHHQSEQGREGVPH